MSRLSPVSRLSPEARQSLVEDARWLQTHVDERKERERLAKPLTNTEILCFVLGWQGGTVHQVAKALEVEVQYILDANHDQMLDLCRKAQLK